MQLGPHRLFGGHGVTSLAIDIARELHVFGTAGAPLWSLVNDFVHKETLDVSFLHRSRTAVAQRGHRAHRDDEGCPSKTS